MTLSYILLQPAMSTCLLLVVFIERVNLICMDIDTSLLFKATYLDK